MCIVTCVLFCCVFLSVTSQKTVLKDNNPFFSFRRYLDFPEGCSFIATGSFIKRLLFNQENGYYAMLGEMDVPFSLPSYSKSKQKRSRFLRRHHREIHRNIEELISQFGLDENCLESIFCEMDRYEFPNNMQFTKHLLKAIATYFEGHGMRKADKLSCEDVMVSCGVSLLPGIINVFGNNTST